jgi:hypothetical protein
MDWIEQELKHGLMQLMCIGLPWAPPPDMMQGTLMAWTAAVKHNRVWDQAMDGPRFRHAFLSMMAECAQWPTPKQFVESMPPRPQLKALPPKPVDQAKVQKMIDELGEAFKWK